MLFIVLSALPSDITKDELLQQILNDKGIDAQELSIFCLKNYKIKQNQQSEKQKLTKAFISVKSEKNISSIVATLDGAQFTSSNSKKDNQFFIASCVSSHIKTDIMKATIQNKMADTLDQDEDFKQFFEKHEPETTVLEEDDLNGINDVQSKISEFVSSRLQVIDVKKAKQRERAKARARAKKLENNNNSSNPKKSPKSKKSKGGYRIVTSKSKVKNVDKTKKAVHISELNTVNPSG